MVRLSQLVWKEASALCHIYGSTLDFIYNNYIHLLDMKSHPSLFSWMNLRKYSRAVRKKEGVVNDVVGMRVNAQSQGHTIRNSFILVTK